MNIDNLSQEEIKVLHALLGKAMDQPKPKIHVDPLNQMIEDIIDGFDFDRVYAVMDAINWQWAGKGVPTIKQLLEQANYLLRGAAKARLGEYKDSYWEIGITHGTGGFQATAYCDENKTKITMLDLKFVLSEWDSELIEEDSE